MENMELKMKAVELLNAKLNIIGALIHAACNDDEKMAASLNDSLEEGRRFAEALLDCEIKFDAERENGHYFYLAEETAEGLN